MSLAERTDLMAASSQESKKSNLRLKWPETKSRGFGNDLYNGSWWMLNLIRLVISFAIQINV